MEKRKIKIGLVAPGTVLLDQELPDKMKSWLDQSPYAHNVELVLHPQCLAADGHFAGTDQQRADALVAMANDPEIDAIWFLRGGYGSCRITTEVIRKLKHPAKSKIYLGYSDTGALLAALYQHKIGLPVHGPMPADLARADGHKAFFRALDFIVNLDSPATDNSPLEPSLDPKTPIVAFNATILASLAGTNLQPNLAGHILMLEEVGEYMYRLDRLMWQITNAYGRHAQLKGIQLGRCSAIPDNIPDFGKTAEAVVKEWCDKSSIPYLGRADIGHDIDNKIVPFGRGLDDRRARHILAARKARNQPLGRPRTGFSFLPKCNL